MKRETFILFPSSTTASYEPDSSFAKEVEGAKSAGFNVGFVDQSVILGGDPIFKKIPEKTEITIHPNYDFIYRGWLMKENYYSTMNHAMIDRYGHRPITHAMNYVTATNLPSWYTRLERLTPNSFWYAAVDPSSIDPKSVAEYVRDNTYGQPLILKDYLKSRKHEWHDACFIPDSWDMDNVRRVIENFITLQGEAFHGGLVFRDFIDFKVIGHHPKSRTPIIHEVRQFYYYDGSIAYPFYQKNYWPELDESAESPPAWYIQNIGKRVRLPFFVVDFGLTTSGHWVPIEVNDGGTAGLPDADDAGTFYESLKRMFDER